MFSIDFAVNRLKLAEILYYKILETIMVQETRRLHGMDMSVSNSILLASFQSYQGSKRFLFVSLFSLSKKVIIFILYNVSNKNLHNFLVFS